MKYKKVTILSIVLAVVMILSAVIIFVINPLNSKLKNEKAIRVVVTQLFTCPNEELIQLYSDMNKELDAYLLERQNDPEHANEGVYVPDENDISSFSKIKNKLMEMYTPYFTDKGYETFYDKLIFNNYVVYSTALGYNTEVVLVEITQSETISSNYSFTVSLRYGPTDGDKKDIEIDGSAQVTEDVGKLSYIQFFDRDLRMELWNQNQSQ